MSAFKVDKVISTLPVTLTPDTVYAVRVGVGFDLYISDNTGTVAHKINGGVGVGGTQEVFVQQTRPVSAGPWIWWETDATGNIIDCTVNDGV